MNKTTLIFMATLMGCTDSEPTSKEVVSKPQLFSFSYPTSYLVERLTGDAAQHRCILPAGEDAAAWKPSTELIIELQQADLLFSNGLGFEGWVQTAALPSSKLVEAASKVLPIEMAGKTHSHGKGGAHSHGEIDPHAWSDPIAYTQMADVVAAEISNEFPSLKGTVEKNLASLKKELSELDARNDAIFADAKGISFAANHPSYSYLMRSQKITIENFDLDPEGEMDAGEVAKLTEWGDFHDNTVLLWEASPMEAHTKQLSFVNHYEIDPLEAPVNGTYDYVVQYKANQKEFAKIIETHAKQDTPNTPE